MIAYIPGESESDTKSAMENRTRLVGTGKPVTLLDLQNVGKQPFRIGKEALWTHPTQHFFKNFQLP